MKLLRGIWDFCYKLVIGECWQIAAIVATVLIVAVMALRWAAVAASILPLLIAGALLILFPLTILFEARTKLRAPKA